MNYCTRQDLIDRFGEDELIQLTDRAGTGAVDDAVLDQAIEDASGEIDGYLASGGYATPLSPVPRIVTAKACDMARHALYDDHATEQVRKRYEDAIRFLRAIADGTVRLGVSAPGPVGSNVVEFDAGRSNFGGGGF